MKKTLLRSPLCRPALRRSPRLLAAALLCLFAVPASAADEGKKGAGESDEEIAAIAGDLPPAGGAADRFGEQIAAALDTPAVSPAGTAASHVDLAYGEHPRQRFDLWLAEGDGPRPLAVFIHGGGFRRGDKALLRRSAFLDRLLAAGISVAGLNYRFSKQHPEGTLGSLRDIARGVQHLRHHAAEYGIDGSRVGAFGGSAGGAASLWLAFRDDLAEPDSTDPVARQSSRIACAGAMAAPATLDLLAWREILGISERQMLRAAASFGVRDESELRSAAAEELRREADFRALLSPGDSPFYMRNGDPDEPPEGVGPMAHHPRHARVLKERADAVGVEAVVYAPGLGLEDPSGEDLVAFFVRHLRSSGGKE